MKEPATDKVAVIMPAYNVELYIGQAIESVLKQTHTNWELWIVDDGSTDQSAQRVNAFDDARIHFYSSCHMGRPSRVRNLGSQLTNCPYLFFLDADDYLMPNALEEALRLMKSNNRYHMVYGFLQAMNSEGQPARSAGFKLVPDIPARTRYRLPEAYSHTPTKVALAQVCISTTFLIEREFFKSLNGFDESLSASEDMDLFFRAFLADWNCIAALPMYLIKYRKNLSSITRSTHNFDRILNSQIRATQNFMAHPACPEEAKSKAPEAFMRRYSYVSGLCLEQGQRLLAVKYCLLAFQHPTITFNAWLRHGLSLIPRACLFPNALDCYLKELAVQLRDGAWKERLISINLQQDEVLVANTSSIGTGI